MAAKKGLASGTTGSMSSGNDGGSWPTVVRLAISVLAGFVVVCLFGLFLHKLGQDSKAWWALLLPIWAAVTLLAFNKSPWPKEV